MAISYASAAKTACEASDWELTNLELHKYLYLSHMRFLGSTNGKPLVTTEFEAWKYGPVIAPLYHKVKTFGNRPIENVFNVTRNLKLPEHKIIRQTIVDYSDLSPGELVELTHEPGGAWDLYYDSDSWGATIPNRAILQEYKKREGHI